MKEKSKGIIIYRAIYAVIFSLFGCGENTPETRFELLDRKETNIRLINEIVESDSINMLEFTNIYNGAGVGVADLNNDEKPDIYFAGNVVSGKLYLNRSQGNELFFEDVTEKSKISTDRWATGVSIADVNMNGWMDLYICVSGSDNPQNRKNYFL